MQRLVARRETLPETARAKELAAGAAAARDRAVLRRTEAADLAREVRKLEDEVQKVRDRATRDDALLQSGDVGSARELTELQHEIESLKRRQSDLEDVELELMERSEEAQAAQTAAEQERDALSEQAGAAKRDAEVALSELATAYRAAAGQRTGLREQIPADLLALYEKIRGDRDGVGAVEFTDECGGCRLQMIPGDRAAVMGAPPDEVVRCEECRRILVRTAVLRP